MLAQIILEHPAGCKVTSHKKKSKVKDQEKASLKSVQVALINPVGQKDA